MTKNTLIMMTNRETVTTNQKVRSIIFFLYCYMKERLQTCFVTALRLLYFH